jgi:ABC-type branched-subunit amino acid transport system ATPase component
MTNQPDALSRLVAAYRMHRRPAIGARMSACTEAQHEAMKASPEAWAALEFCGIQKHPAETIGGVAYSAEPALELRNCACGTTLAIEVTS